jgi:hypothetical protein
MMLPYMEQQPLYNALNFGLSPGTGGNWGANEGQAENTTVTYTSLNVFQCPSDSDRLTSASGHNSYYGDSGSSPDSFDNVGSFNGIFILSNAKPKGVGIRDVLDGTSNTVAFSERVKGMGTNSTTWDSTIPTSTISSIATPSSTNTPQAGYTLCNSTKPNLTNTKNSNRAAGQVWHIGYASVTRFVHVMPPNSWNCGYQGDGGGMQGVYGASSRHPGIVNVAMCDGSIRSIKNSVGITVWWALGTIANNEVLDASTY